MKKQVTCNVDELAELLKRRIDGMVAEVNNIEHNSRIGIKLEPGQLADAIGGVKSVSDTIIEIAEYYTHE